MSFQHLSLFLILATNLIFLISEFMCSCLLNLFLLLLLPRLLNYSCLSKGTPLASVNKVSPRTCTDAYIFSAPIDQIVGFLIGESLAP